MRALVQGIIAISLLLLAAASGASTRGYIAGEATGFPDEGAFPNQGDGGVSASIEVEYQSEWNNGADSFTIKPFARWDSQDGERSHVDVREAVWLHIEDSWESRIGVSKVFWGVIESNHLVDIINQTDQVEDIRLEEKLGQPMLNFTYTGFDGALDLFVLPYFRERTYPGEEGRFRGPVPVNTDDPVYESSREEKHVDYSVRWASYLGELEYAIAFFDGTIREPYFLQTVENGSLVELTPYYVQMQRVSIEGEYLVGDWTLKLEALYQDDELFEYGAVATGFEYTFYDVKYSGVDLGFLAEYHYDSRDEDSQQIYQNDTFIGGRIEVNDTASTQVVGGVLYDNEYGGQYWTVEGSTRIGEHWKVFLNAQWVIDAGEEDPLLFQVREDSFVRAEVRLYF
ncbi:hypothetical protein A3709_20855 [Halioglobus sp. HI00S01]|uniref:hypothetical protein n=1 Tax=Halioglobus sp. HI00S01 TaxID=1822214 RepID=UPI0007C29E2B|nr:hypothetical protein [Halioglobus sp. HI00S01]KZX58065.1 hypothetical protein A3709_20855 [Halioglobus sp. HI00S01]